MRHLLAAIVFLTLLRGYNYAQGIQPGQPEERTETPYLEKDKSESVEVNLVQRDGLEQLDSIYTTAENSLNQFRHSYDSAIKAGELASMNVQRSIDSLSDLNLPTGKLG
jgi:hypothetical protein